jgi:hypothetical protein
VDIATQARQERKHGARPKARPTIGLTTAAALANGGQPAPPVDLDAFRQGMWVLHSTYGLGQIIALSGIEESRRATVQFPPPAGRQRLLLADGSLQPVGM